MNRESWYRAIGPLHLSRSADGFYLALALPGRRLLGGVMWLPADRRVIVFGRHHQPRLTFIMHRRRRPA